MKIFGSILMAITIASASIININSNITETKSDSIDSYLKGIYESSNIPGFSLSLTDKDNTIASYNYGTVKDNDKVVFIGSESKSFTALATMKLYKENKLDLDKDITEYIDITLSKPVTVKMLLNQTSGFDEYQMLNHASVNEAKYNKFQYSNENYDTLGRIIESVSGKSYSEYVEENILAPLNMTNTYSNVNKIPQNAFEECYRNYYGLYIKSNIVYPTNNGWFNVPAGYIASSANDMMKYLRMYLNKGNGIFDEAIINEMINSRVVSSPDNRTFYGYGLFICDYYGTKIIFHQGLTECCQTYMFIIPSIGIAGEFIIPSYDQFGNTDKFESVAFNVINLLLDRNQFDLDMGYAKAHTVTALVYLLILAISITIFSFGVMIFIRRKSYKFNIIHGVISVIVLIILSIFPPILGVSYFAFSHYVPDGFIVMIVSIIFTSLGILTNCSGILYKNLKK